MVAAGIVLLLAFVFTASKVAVASEAQPSLLTTAPADDEIASIAVGHQFEAQTVAVDPVTRHIFVTDWQGGPDSNNRIDEYTAWGEFVKAFGFGVRNGADELQTCTKQTGCLQGSEGSQPGEFNLPNGLSFDAAGNLYVFERRNARVQKFDPHAGAGGEEVQFLLEWGSVGTGSGQFNISNVAGVEGNYMAIDQSSKVNPGGTVYVADKGRIQAFDTSGVFKKSISLPEDLNPGALAFDPVSGDLYFAFNQEGGGVQARPKIFCLKASSGEVVKEIVPDVVPDQGPAPEDKTIALAVDPVGNLYVVDDPQGGSPARVQKYSSAGELLIEFDQGGAGILETGLAAATVGAEASEVDVYVAHHSSTPGTSSVKFYGAIPDPNLVGPPPPVPPTITQQFAVSVNETEATVRAAINPNFWTDTRYYVEYGPVECKTSSCTEFPTPPGSLLSTKVTKTAIKSQGVDLTGLTPGAKYFYRFVAQSAGGGPVFGVDPDGEGPEEATFADGLEATFTTRAVQGVVEPCPPNEAFRPEPAAKLPDCRAYEMVSPVDKNGADVSLLLIPANFFAGFNQTAPSGEEITYSAYRAFGDAEAAPYAVQYLASRSAGGWLTHAIAPPQEGPSVLQARNLDTPYKAFSTNLGEGWLLRDTATTLDPQAPAGYGNLYRHSASGDYEAMVRVEPFLSPDKFLPVLEGHGGGCAVFAANDALTEGAAGGGKNQLYRSCPGQPLALVSVLPGGAAAGEASVGTGGAEVGSYSERTSSLNGAVSENGQTVFWSNKEKNPGKLFARIGNTETQALSAGPAQFWAGAADGSKAIFSEGDELYEFTIGQNAEEDPTEIAGEVDGVVGTSADASVVYLLSEEELDGGATAGEPNLYRYDSAGGGSFTFVARLGAKDAIPLMTALPGPVKTSPVFHTAQVTPDGGAVLFSSVGQPTGFDNTDAETGKADSEAYLYRAAGEELICLSCSPGGVRPTGREVVPTGFGVTSSVRMPTAGEVPAAYNSLYAPRILSEEGTRAYFNSYVPLVRGDTNGRGDVYQWEASGEGTCKVGAPGYDAAWAGCVQLISSGESPQDSTFVDSSSDGRDVFFKTNASLLPQDPGLLDIYDARAGGGFPLQSPPPPICEGEACQNPAPAPQDQSPASGVPGPGNAKHTLPVHCRKGTHKQTKHGKQVCVKNKKKKQHNKKQSHKSGRAGR